MRLAPGYVLCACSWHGHLGAKEWCPSCGRPAIDRLDAARLAVLRAVIAQPEVEIHRMQRIRLIEIGVIRRDSPRTPPNDGGRHRRAPLRRHAVTQLGVEAVATADAIVREREDQQRREYVAAAAARHADFK